MKVNEKLHPPVKPRAAPIIDSKKSTDTFNSILLPQYANGDSEHLQIWPDPKRKYNDRILDQMRYVPKSALSKDPELESSIKTIYLPGGIGGDTPKGRMKFKDEKCPIDMCWITDR